MVLALLYPILVPGMILFSACNLYPFSVLGGLKGNSKDERTEKLYKFFEYFGKYAVSKSTNIYL